MIVSLGAFSVHPRVCGEHSDHLQRRPPDRGSSPRVRGTLARAQLQDSIRRFIPACAGNTSRISPARSSRPVHPRVCGEHIESHPDRLAADGSSPRVRGTRRPRPRRGRAPRFIPACAGNTARPSGRSATFPVHPRVCGEHERFDVTHASLSGSSPRVRGTQMKKSQFEVNVRFIPACAGNTLASGTKAVVDSVHPRVCGEHSGTKAPLDSSVGSSPRVRGTPRPRRAEPDRDRFIPACAGNTRRRPPPRRAATVHPRVCGEHVLEIAPEFLQNGSSPRVRGTRRRFDGRRPRPRFIPACAGNTPNAHVWVPASPVHPRVCGEHVRPERRRRVRRGSSPRVRGTRADRQWYHQPRRFIPACAGNT